jgi:hypothetical protein
MKRQERVKEQRGLLKDGHCNSFYHTEASGIKNVIQVNFPKCLRFKVIDVRQRLLVRCFIIIALFLKH